MVSKKTSLLLIIAISLFGCSSRKEPDTSAVTNNYTGATPISTTTPQSGSSQSDPPTYNPPANNTETETPVATFSGPAIYRSNLGTDYLFSTAPLEGPKGRVLSGRSKVCFSLNFDFDRKCKNHVQIYSICSDVQLMGKHR